MSIEKHIYFESKLERWSDIFRLSPMFMNKFIFRGQGSADWELSSSLERSIKKLYPYNIDTALYPLEEKELLKEFKWKYPLYSNSQPENSDDIEWLTIMQHYSAPTRLLDITNSLFVAVYFALADMSGKNAAIWAINKHQINSDIFHRYRLMHDVKGVAQDILDEEALNQANEIILDYSFDKDYKPSLFLIKPKRPNERISRQQGAFLMPSNIMLPFSENIKPYSDNDIPMKIDFSDLLEYSDVAQYRQDDISIMKIIIPRNLFYDVSKSLRAMNITSEILFPGLDGLCKSLSHLRYQGMGN